MKGRLSKYFSEVTLYVLVVAYGSSGWRCYADIDFILGCLGGCWVERRLRDTTSSRSAWRLCVSVAKAAQRQGS